MFSNDEFNIKALLLIDDYTQRKLQVSTSEIVSNGIKVIYSLADINDDILKAYSNVVIILEDYILHENSMSDLRLYKAVFELQYIYMGSQDIWVRSMNEIADRCYKMDVTKLSYNQIFATLMRDSALLDKYVLKPQEVENALINLKQKIIEEQSYTEAVKKLFESSYTLVEILKDRDEEIKALHSRNANLELEAKNSIEQSDIIYKELNRLMDSERDRDIAIRQYEVLLTKDIYTKLMLMNYPKKPKLILYFKQFTKMNNFDLFVLTLYNVFRIHKGMSCKILKLYDSKDSIQIRLQPSYIHVIRNSYKAGEIEVNDLLAKYGDYTEVLNILLTNKIGCDVLIVFDCKCHNDRVLQGDTLNFDICQSKEEVKVLGLDSELTVVNDDFSSPLQWYTEEEELEGMNDEETLRFLSAKPAIQSILSSVTMYLEEG